MRAISWLAEELLASQEGFCSMESDSNEGQTIEISMETIQRYLNEMKARNFGHGTEFLAI
jgi:hypothetical protein